MANNPARKIKLGRSVDPNKGPNRTIFPVDRTIRWVPRAAASLPKPDVDFVVDQRVLLQVNAHVSESIEREIGGFLLGNRYQCKDTGREFVMVDQYSPAEFTEGTAVSLAFTEDSWAKLQEERDGKFNGKLLVGWYHSHPRMNIFLSAHDVPIHDQKFREAWQSALVIDPDMHQGGFFCRRRGALNSRIPCEFFEYLEGEEIKTRESVMDWEGYYALDRHGRTIEVKRSPKKAESRPQRGARCLPAVSEASPAAVPEKMQPFPAERVIHWLPNGEVSVCSDALLLVTQSIFEAICHNLRSGSADAGFLLGNAYRCPRSRRRYLVIDQLSPAALAAPGANSVFTVDSVARLKEELAGKYLGKEVVGWYQPFTSEDVFRPDPVFPELADEFPVLVMVDAAHGRGCVLRSRDGGPVDFFELKEVGSGSAPVVTWSNYHSEHPGSLALVPAESALAPSGTPEPPLIEPSPFAKSSIRNWLIYAGIGLLAMVIGGFAMFLWLQRPTSAAIPAAASKPTPTGVNIVVFPKRVDLNDPKKGLRLTLAIVPAPGDFDLKVRNEQVAYNVVDNKGAGSNSVMVETTLKDGLTTQELSRGTGQLNLDIQIFKKDTGNEIGQLPYILSISELSTKVPSVAKKNTEESPLPPGAKGENGTALSEPARSNRKPTPVALPTDLESGNKEPQSQLEPSAPSPQPRDPKQPATPATSTPVAATTTVRTQDFDYSSLASRTDDLTRALTTCLQQETPDLPRCARIVVEKQSLVKDLLKIEKPLGPFPRVKTIFEKLSNPKKKLTKKELEKELPELRAQLWAIYDKLKAQN